MSTEAYYENYWSPRGFRPLGKPNPTLEALFRDRLSWARNCLDVGCGDGGTVGPIALSSRVDYVGVDISEAAVRLANEQGFRAVVVESSDALPFSNGSFDAVFLVEVLEHLFDPLATLNEVHRVLAPGGVVVITVPNVAYWRWRADLFVLGRWNPLGDELSAEQPWRDPHIRFFTTKALAHLLDAAGFPRHAIWGDHGSMLRDFPLLRRAWRGPGRTYGFFQRLFPSLLGYRLVALAEKVL
jgi:methionine biosynthesis protein MetW